MALILDRSKTHEFRKVLYPSSVQYIWFYETAPISAIRYICRIGPAVRRPPQVQVLDSVKPNPGFPLPSEGVGISEYNSYHPEHYGYDYAYPILAAYAHPGNKMARTSDDLDDKAGKRSDGSEKELLSLSRMKAVYGMKGAPRVMMYVPEELMVREGWKDGRDEQGWIKLWEK